MHKIIINILEQHGQTCPQSLLSATISHEIFLIEFAWTFKLNPKLYTNTLIQTLIWDSLGLQSHKIPRTLQYKCKHVLMFNYKNMYLVLMQQCLLHCSFVNYKGRVHACFCSLESEFFLKQFFTIFNAFFHLKVKVLNVLSYVVLLLIDCQPNLTHRCNTHLC